MSQTASRASIQYSRARPPGCGCGVGNFSCSVGPAPGAAAARKRGAWTRRAAASAFARVAGLREQDPLAADRAQERARSSSKEAAAW